MLAWTALSAYFKAPEILLVAIALGGCSFLLRFTHLHPIAVIALCGGAMLLSLSVTLELYRDNSFGAAGFAMHSLLCITVAIVASLIAALVGRSDSRLQANFACFAAAVLALFGWWTIESHLRSYRAQLESEQVAETFKAAEELVSAIESIRVTQGRLPSNEEEVEEMLGRPMPTSGWGDRFEYQLDKSDPNHYSISCLTQGLAAIFYDYESRTPERGVFTYPF